MKSKVHNLKYKNMNKVILILIMNDLGKATLVSIPLFQISISTPNAVYLKNYHKHDKMYANIDKIINVLYFIR